MPTLYMYLNTVFELVVIALSTIRGIRDAMRSEFATHCVALVWPICWCGQLRHQPSLSQLHLATRNMSYRYSCVAALVVAHEIWTFQYFLSLVRFVAVKFPAVELAA